MKTLTTRQQQILSFLQQHAQQHGRPPTLREICEEMGFASPNAAKQHLQALARKGFIALEEGAARGIQLLQDSIPDGLPIIGRVAAGQPILAQENQEGVVSVDPSLFRGNADYLLRVQGDSMRDAGILDGDLLAVRRSPTAQDGETVVARIEDEVTVKRLQRHGHIAELHPENPDFSVITVDMTHQELAIEGIAVGVIRTAV